MSTLSEKLQAPAEHAAKQVRPSPSVLSVREVRISDQAAGREIVHGVSFDLTPGRTVGIVGESGSGKTLTCRAALGILPSHFEVTGGSIELDGHDITGFSPPSGPPCGARRSARSSRTRPPTSTPRSAWAPRSPR